MRFKTARPATSTAAIRGSALPSNEAGLPAGAAVLPSPRARTGPERGCGRGALPGLCADSDTRVAHRGPASDRFGGRPVVLPFVVLSPLATLLLVLGPEEVPAPGPCRPVSPA
jgi:hypothetical protein